MSQDIYSNIDPTVTTGLMLAGLLDDFKDALMSGFSGTSRPTKLQAGGMWIDTSQQEAPNYYWSAKIYTGSADIEIFRISVLTADSGFTLALSDFTVRKISADTSGAILELIKNRIASNGQVQSGDVVGELRLSGRTDTATDPIVAYFRVTASENQTATNRGVTLSLVSAPVGTNQLFEHLRFLSENVEFVLSHKSHSTIFGSDDVPTASSLLLTGDKILSELSGSTEADVHGIEVVDGDTRVKYIHNRSSAEVTIKHESATAAAAERFKLPDSQDLILLPECSAAFYYCTTDSRWKYLLGNPVNVRGFVYNFMSGYSEWVAPFTGNVRVVSFQEPTSEPSGPAAKNGFSRSALKGLFAWGDNTHGQLGVGDALNRSMPSLIVGGVQFKDAMVSDDNGCGITYQEEAYAWGLNNHGQLGVGDVLPRSSPVAVAGGLNFTRVDVSESSYGIQFSGAAYAWGRNQHGQLGVGDVTPRSSPVAVAGGLKFAAIFRGVDGEGSAFGVERDSGALYAWGQNNQGRLGVGDIIPRSTPTAVLGGLKFKKVVLGLDCTLGITESGVPYAWGDNPDGALGVGDVSPRSSPVAVLGGLVFRDVFTLFSGLDTSFYGLTDDGALYAWGANANGQLGVGDVTPRSSPVAVLGGLRWENIARLSTGDMSIIAIQKGTGSAYAWGNNDSGQLGVGDTTPRSSPVAVAGGLKFSYINMGLDMAYGCSSDGKFYAWGLNDVGQLGDETTVSKSSPVVVHGVTEPMFEVPTTKVIPVVEGQTYKIKIGGGVSFFGNTQIGKNVRRATVSFDK